MAYTYERKQKKYLNCTVVREAGITFSQPLRLGEASLISQIAQDEGVKKIIISLEKTTPDNFKAIFG